MITWVVVAVVVLVGWHVWRWYRYQKGIAARRRYADTGARCAADAGFLMDDYSDGLWGDNPVYNFKHRVFPDLILSIQNNRWTIRESAVAGLAPLAEPQFKDKRGEHLSVSDFRDIAEEYRAVVEWRRRAVGWGCVADLRRRGAELHDCHG